MFHLGLHLTLIFLLQDTLPPRTDKLFEKFKTDLSGVLHRMQILPPHLPMFSYTRQNPVQTLTVNSKRAENLYLYSASNYFWINKRLHSLSLKNLLKRDSNSWEEQSSTKQLCMWAQIFCLWALNLLLYMGFPWLWTHQLWWNTRRISQSFSSTLLSFELMVKHSLKQKMVSRLCFLLCF